MRIELLYFEDCPSYRALLPELHALLKREGIDDEIEMRSVETLDAAEEEHFLGSPTLRINGEDIDPDAAPRTDFGMKCRLYRSEEGTFAIPPERWIVDALRRANQEGKNE